MIRRILVPLDGSRFAETALFAASSLARHCGAELRLIRVVDPMSTSASEADEAERARSYIERIRRSRGTADGPVTAVVRRGVPGEEILREVSESGCDLVVMSTHARNHAARFFLGSVADHYVQNTAVPVLLIRSWGHSGAWGYKRVVISLGETTASAASIPIGIEMARLFGARVSLLHSVPRSEARETEELRAADLARSVSRLADGGTPVDAKVVVEDRPLHTILASCHDSLVVMGRSTRKPLLQVLIGSAVDSVVHERLGPVLVVPTPASRTAGAA